MEAMPSRSLARNRGFVLLTAGQVVSFIGSQAQGLAVPLLVVALLRSASAAGIVLALNSVVSVLVGLVAGVVVDRHDRKWTMVIADLVRALASMAIPIMLWLHRSSLLLICCVVALSAALATVFNAANTAALPNLVEPDQFSTAMSRYQQWMNAVRFFGATLSGLLYEVGRAVPFVVNAASFLVSAGSLATIRTRFQARTGRGQERLREELRAGFSFLWHHGRLRALTLLDAGDNLRFAGGYLIIILIARKVGADALGIGAIFSGAAAGALLGSLAAPRVLDRLPLGTVSLVNIWAEALSFPLYAICRDPLEVAAVAAFESLVDPSFTIGVATYTARITPDELRGRVAAASQLIVGGVAPAGLLLAGTLTSTLGVRLTAVIFGSWLLVLAVVASISPNVRRSESA
jgi:MFS family permease